MRNTHASEYLQIIADWQASTGSTGVPPVEFHKKLSNWVQWCRTVGRRGKLNKDIAASLTKLGISIERGPSDAHATNADSYANPRGMMPVLRAAARYLRENGVPPSLLSPSVTVRHQATWLVRLLAGILPANSFGWTAPIEDQLLPEQLLELVGAAQSPQSLVAEWILWCARAQCGAHRQAQPRAGRTTCHEGDPRASRALLQW